MAHEGGSLVEGSQGAQNLIEDVQQQLYDVLGPEALEDDALARYVVVLLCSGADEDKLTEELRGLLDDFGPELLAWCVACCHAAAAPPLLCATPARLPRSATSTLEKAYLTSADPLHNQKTKTGSKRRSKRSPRAI